MEFQKVADTLKRMWDYERETDEDTPLTKECQSSYWEDWCAWACSNVEKVEEMCKDWEKEHPAPIYPTFGEYLRDMANHAHAYVGVPLEEIMDLHIPPEIAKLYEIAPLNLCGINKYVSEWR